MKKVKEFLRRKNIVFSVKRYFVDAMGAMAQGLFCTLLVGTILNTLGTQFNIGFLSNPVVSAGGTAYTIGGMASTALASAVTGPVATCLFKLKMNGAAVSSGMGTCGFVGQIGICSGWIKDGDLKLNL